MAEATPVEATTTFLSEIADAADTEAASTTSTAEATTTETSTTDETTETITIAMDDGTCAEACQNDGICMEEVCYCMNPFGGDHCESSKYLINAKVQTFVLFSCLLDDFI